MEQIKNIYCCYWLHHTARICNIQTLLPLLFPAAWLKGRDHQHFLKKLQLETINV